MEDLKDKVSFPEKSEKKKKGFDANTIILLIAVFIMFGVILYLELIKGSEAAAGIKSTNGENAGIWRELSSRLAKDDVEEAQTSALERYLNASTLPAEERSNVYYKLGTAYMGLKDYPKALSSFYLAEITYPDTSLKNDISRYIDEALRRMGKYSAARRETKERSLLDKSEGSPDGSEVVARMEGRDITVAQLEREIEKEIDSNIKNMMAGASEKEAENLKKNLLKRFEDKGQKMEFLKNYLATELIYRKALESNIDKEPGIQAEMGDISRKLLAQEVISREIKEKVNPTPSDIENFFLANKDRYSEPEKVKIAHILVKDEEKAKEVRGRIKGPDDFERIAKECSEDTETKDKGGEISSWITKGAKYIPGIGDGSAVIDEVFNTEAGKLAGTDLKTEKGIHIIMVKEKKAKVEKGIDEVRDRVEAEWRRQKDGEVTEDLMKRILQENKVEILIK